MRRSRVARRSALPATLTFVHRSAAVLAGLLLGLLPTSTAAAADPAADSTAATPASAGGDVAGSTDRYVAVTENADGTPRFESFEAGSPFGLVEKVAEIAERSGSMINVVPDSRVRLLETASAATDPLRQSQWALDAVPFEGSLPASDGSGVVVAVVDTGVEANHEDLAGSVLTGWDFTGTTAAGVAGGTTDPRGHGTHVAGTIAAHRNNNVGGTGVAPGAKILPVRVLDAAGEGWASDIANGIVWSADHGADVINLSLGGTEGGDFYIDAIRYARGRGVVVVAAAGNEAEYGNPVVYPGAVPEAIAVAALEANGSRAPFSSYGSWVDIAAPGALILGPCPASASTCPRTASAGSPAGYARRSGTSMAAPHVSGAVALMLGSNPNLKPAEVEATLLGTADDLGPAGYDWEFGSGLVDPIESMGAFHPGTGAGYWIVGRNGRVAAVGSAPVLGGTSTGGVPIVAAAGTRSGAGYWLTAADGAVYAKGDAVYYGGMGGRPLNAPIVGMSVTATGRGYWLLAADGGVFSFGDAPFYGSTGAMRLNRPVVDMAPTPSGRGYWMVASDGGVFSFGDAVFAGSTGAMVLNRPVTSMAASPSGGYWLIGSDGGIFAFGVPFWGSLPGLNNPNLPGGSRIRLNRAGNGYYILGTDGQVFAFAGAAPLGALPAAYRAGFEAVDLVLFR